MLGSGYMGSEGLYRALKKNGYLGYAFNTVNKEQFFDLDKYRANPILMIRGMLEKRVGLAIRGQGQFIATWQSESFYTRHGEMDRSTPLMLEHQDKLNMVFVCICNNQRAPSSTDDMEGHVIFTQQ